MDSRSMTKEERIVYWAQIMQEWSESGLSKKAFCAKIGIKTGKFYYWRNKLREANSINPFVYTPEPAEVVSVSSPCGFTEVLVSEPSGEISTLQVNTSKGLVYIEVSGLTIKADYTYPVSHLAELLKELLHPC